MSERSNRRLPRKLCPLAFGAISLGAFVVPAHGELRAYYTLNDIASGIQNAGMDGPASDLTLFSGPDASQKTGIIGSSLQFAGSSIYTTAAAGNAAADLLGFPFTFSIWVADVTADTSSDTAFSVSDSTDLDTYWSLGVSSNEVPQIVRRNGSNVFGTEEGAVNTATSTWHNIVGVFSGARSFTVYVDGKTTGAKVEGTDRSAVFDIDPEDGDGVVNALSVGGISRTNGGTAQAAAQFKGKIDDVGLFDTELVAADVALINGLGHTSGLGLDWLDEAQLLNGSALNTEITIGGKEWKRVTGLIGAIGDYGGTLAAGNAFIITGANGDGIAIPEPASAATFLGMGMLMLRRARARVH